MDIPRKDDDTWTDGEEKKMAVEGEATAVDDDLTSDLQSLALTAPEKNEENRTMSDGMRGSPMRGRPILGRHSIESAIPSVPSSPPKPVPPPIRKSRHLLDFTDVPCMSELSSGLGKQPENPCKETNQSMVGSSACVPQQQSTQSSSEEVSKQQPTSSTPKNTLEWRLMKPAFADSSTQFSLNSLAYTMKQIWRQCSPEEAAKLRPKLPCKAPAPSPTKGVPEEARSELSTGLGKQPENPCKETNKSMVGSSACVPQQQSTQSSSEEVPKQQSTPSTPEEVSKQQPTPSTPKNTLDWRLTLSSPLSSPEDYQKPAFADSSIQFSLNSLENTMKQIWTQCSPEEAAKLHPKLPCKAPAPSPTKGVPEEARSAALDAMENIWGSPPLQNVFLRPAKPQTKRNIETSACGSDCGASSPNTKRHRTDDVIQPLGQLSPRRDGQGSSAGDRSSDQPPARRAEKRKNSSELETVLEGEEKKKWKEEEENSD